MDADYEICPTCQAPFAIMDLIEHAPKCGKAEANPTLDPDEEFARRLQEEEKKQSQSVACQACTEKIPIERLYILDDCTHKFCKPCLVQYVSTEIAVSVTVLCPLKGCKIALSVNDMKNLLPTKSNNNNKSSPFNPKEATGKATERILNEFKSITKTQPEKNGYTVAPIDDNLYKWELKMFNFDKTDPLGKDLEKLGSGIFRKDKPHVLFNITFPKNYPFSPPYIRILRPRFQFHTGHVTLGGSVCMEVLTNKGWSPQCSLESIIMSIRAQLIEGGARLDFSNKHDYTEQEAREAFDRMVQTHGWY